MTENYRKSRKQSCIGLLLVFLSGCLFVVIGTTEVRFSLKGLEQVSGRVISAESYKAGRHRGYSLIVMLDTGGGVLRLSQEATGHFAHRLAPGQAIRAWVNPPDADSAKAAERRVWQIERGGTVVMPVMEAGDRVFDRLLWQGGAALIPLLGGLYLVARHWMRYHDQADEITHAEGQVR